MCYFIFLKNVNGLIKISNNLIPILIFFIIYISLKNDSLNISILNCTALYIKQVNFSASISMLIKSIIKSVLYASYNCILLIPVLVTLKEQIKNSKKIISIAVASSVLLMLLSFSVFNILSNGSIEDFKLEMPIISIVKQNGIFYQKIYLVIIGISIFTTAVSSGCSFLNNCSNNKKQFKRYLILMSISAIFLSQISFSTLVNLLYPVLGIVGIIEIIIIFMIKPCKKV